VQRTGKYYYTKNKSTLVAFTVGGKFNLSEGDRSTDKSGCVIIGGHTDSPNLRVKPRSKRGGSAGGVIQLGVECYGGGLWNTWFDRDLGISGRVFIRTDDSGNIRQQLIKIDRPLLRISNLAIHLQNDEERKGFSPNKEEHLSPILAMEVQKALSGSTMTGDIAVSGDAKVAEDGWTEHQEPYLLYVLASELGCTTSDIVDFELNLFDVQKATLGGAFSEFVYSSRLDNLASCFMAVRGLIAHATDVNQIEDDKDIMMILLYDHEEVGSTSAVGAASPILAEAVKSLSEAFCKDGGDKLVATQTCTRNSFILSSDQAHALHPNYSAKHEKNHQPKLNQGMVIKRNSNQRYATTALTGILMREVAKRGSLPPLQEFMVRQDCGCGSTIGPTMSANTGIRTIDMGCPQLSMHSIREIMGMKDLTNGINLFKAYFKHFREVDSSVEQ
jgi:aspartyl aminopeptidase